MRLPTTASTFPPAVRVSARVPIEYARGFASDDVRRSSVIQWSTWVR